MNIDVHNTKNKTTYQSPPPAAASTPPPPRLRQPLYRAKNASIREAVQESLTIVLLGPYTRLPMLKFASPSDDNKQHQTTFGKKKLTRKMDSPVNPSAANQQIRHWYHYCLSYEYYT